MNKSLRRKLRELKKKRVKRRIPIAPPSRRHKTKKDYKRVKRVIYHEDTDG